MSPIQNREPKAAIPEAIARKLGVFSLEGVSEGKMTLVPNVEGLRIGEDHLRRALERTWLWASDARVQFVNNELRQQKDLSTLGHQFRVAVLAAAFAEQFAEELDMTEEEIDAVVIAGLAHDTGKSKAQHIYQKRGPLSSRERDEIREHPAVSRNAAKGAGITNPIILYLIENHHDELVEKPEQNVKPYGDHTVPLPADEAGKQHAILLKQLFTRCDYLEANSSLRPRIYQDDDGTRNPVYVIQNKMPYDLTPPDPRIEKLFTSLVAVPITVA